MFTDLTLQLSLYPKLVTIVYISPMQNGCQSEDNYLKILAGNL